MIWQPLLAIDFDKWAAETYRANFAGVRVECGPVSDYIDVLPYADIIVGGPPCQPHSHAGKRLASADARDGGDDFAAAIRKVQPRHFLMENVPGLLTSEGGRYWHRLWAMLTEAGYELRQIVQDAVGFGVPQFRNRLWVWGIRGDLHAAGMRHRFPRPTHTWPPPEDCMFGGALLAGVTVGQAIGSMMGEMTMKSWPHGYWGEFSKKHPHASLDKPAPTLSCDWISTQSAGLVDVVGTGMMRNFTPREGQRIQSMPDRFRWPDGIPISAKTTIVGNGWACAHAAAFSRAMAAVDPEARTVIDLFCGGGLGAVGWHRRYWEYANCAEGVLT